MVKLLEHNQKSGPQIASSFLDIYIYIWVQRTTTSYFRTPRKIAGNKVEDSTQCQPEAAEEEKQTDDEAVEPPNEENTGSEEKEIGDENEENENEDGDEEEDENEDEFEDENKKKGTYKEIIDIYFTYLLLIAFTWQQFHKKNTWVK